MVLNITQAEKLRIKSGDSKCLLKCLESQRTKEVTILVASTRTSDIDNQSKGSIQCLDVIIKLLS